MAEDGGQDRHDDEGAESGGEDQETGVLHGHEGSDKERLVTNLGEDDHDEGQGEGVHGRVDGALFAALRVAEAGVLLVCDGGPAGLIIIVIIVVVVVMVIVLFVLEFVAFFGGDRLAQTRLQVKIILKLVSEIYSCVKVTPIAQDIPEQPSQSLPFLQRQIFRALQ